MSQQDTPTEGTPTKPELIVPSNGFRGMTPLHYAAYLNNPEEVIAELQQGIPVDVRDDNGWTPLHWSIDMSQAWGEPEEVVSILLKARASPNSQDNFGFSVLMMACGRNNQNILEQLIQAGAEIELRSTESSPLHEAAGCNFTEAIQLLLVRGANSLQIDSRGRTPEKLAEDCGFDESVVLLKAALSGK